MENKKEITGRSVLAYGMGGFGRQSLYIIQNTFLLYYFVSVAGLNSAAVGMAFAGVTLISKIGEGISAALMGVVLGAIGYVQDAEIQTASTVLGLQHLSSTVPLAFVVIMLVILLGNDMDKKHAEYEQQLAAQHSAVL